jgi:hypothetical protein
MSKHVNFDFTHMKGFIKHQTWISSVQCDQWIDMCTKWQWEHRSLIKTKEVPSALWRKHYQNHGYMSQFCTQFFTLSSTSFAKSSL